MSKNKCLIYGAEQIVQVCSNRERFLRSEAAKNLSILNRKPDTDLCIVTFGQSIKFVGYQTDKTYQEEFKNLDYDHKINAANCCILPGLIDSHTHPIWAGDRINEFKMKV